MRNLNTADLFKAMRIVKHSNVKEELKPVLARTSEKGVDATDIGIEAILCAVGALGGTSAEGAIYDFLSGPFEMDQKDVSELPLEELIAKIEWMWNEGDLKVFFNRLFDLNTSKS